jgi:hypothetical protein
VAVGMVANVALMMNVVIGKEVAVRVVVVCQ